jgi:transposase
LRSSSPNSLRSTAIRWISPCCGTAGHSHDYKRHGTTTLFAAFEVATGMVTAAHKKRRRRKEFLAFMDNVVATYPKTRLEVILDNLSTHKKNVEWLARHPLVTFDYTPTRASWLNQVEGWFSILQGQSLTGASFTSVEQLKEHIDAFIESYNEDAEPFRVDQVESPPAPRQRAPS